MRTVSTVQKRVDIRRNDNVKVITGRDKGKEGRVLRVFPNDNKLLVEHVMMVKKHVRPNPQRNIAGGIAEQESRIALSNVSATAINRFLISMPIRLPTPACSTGVQSYLCHLAGVLGRPSRRSRAHLPRPTRKLSSASLARPIIPIPCSSSRRAMWRRSCRDSRNSCLRDSRRSTQTTEESVS